MQKAARQVCAEAVSDGGLGAGRNMPGQAHDDRKRPREWPPQQRRRRPHNGRQRGRLFRRRPGVLRLVFFKFLGGGIFPRPPRRRCGARRPNSGGASQAMTAVAPPGAALPPGSRLGQRFLQPRSCRRHCTPCGGKPRLPRPTTYTSSTSARIATTAASIIVTGAAVTAVHAGHAAAARSPIKFSAVSAVSVHAEKRRPFTTLGHH
ncbi:unnamed protein product, partial [Phaeothamnion confervicola]